MNRLNIHGRHPNELPDKETINDILLELNDTSKFNIKWVDLNPIWLPERNWYREDWKANGKRFNEWVEEGEVISYDVDYTPHNLLYDNDIPCSFANIRETRYYIFRKPIKLEVELRTDLISSINENDIELINNISKETLLRLIDYLGTDVIQYQQQIMDFDIEFMISSFCK